MSDNKDINESFIDSFFGGVGDSQQAAPVVVDTNEGNSTFKREPDDDTPINQLLGVEPEEKEEEEEPENILILGKPAEKKEIVKTPELGLNTMVSSLIQKGTIFGFEEDSEIKTEKDFEELIQANKAEWQREAIEEQLEEVFGALPNEIQYAVEYIKNGGTDLKSLFKVLSQTEDIKSFDTAKNSNDIVRTYLQYTKYGSAEEIEEQVAEWKDLDLLEKKAELFKPKLEKLQEEVVQEKLKEQEETKVYQKKLAKQYFDGIADALQDKNLNGIAINKEEQSIIYSDLTENNYTSSRTGQPINFLGKFLETITWDKPDYKTLAELTLFAKDPAKYKEKIRTSQKEVDAADTARKLKTSQGGLKPVGTEIEDPKTFTAAKKTITRNSILKK